VAEEGKEEKTKVGWVRLDATEGAESFRRAGSGGSALAVVNLRG
jgi:hypothetical protein